MARQIVKQPNGLYAMWSTIVDDFLHVDLTRDEYITIRASEEAERVREELERAFDKGTGGYFTDYEDCIEMIELRKKDEANDCADADE